jgi:hypothetical protein
VDSGDNHRWLYGIRRGRGSRLNGRSKQKDGLENAQRGKWMGLHRERVGCGGLPRSGDFSTTAYCFMRVNGAMGFFTSHARGLPAFLRRPSRGAEGFFRIDSGSTYLVYCGL